MQAITKAEKTKVTSLFNLLAEANGEDPNDLLHQLKVKELEKNNIDEGSRMLLQQMAKLQVENSQLRKKQEESPKENRADLITNQTTHSKQEGQSKSTDENKNKRKEEE
ncbi:hypothetical protein HB837_14650 [Listeria innocua]|uniref:hypothetical protein n=1 Tax=Listeria innocua TaxID=1642 RepID=UPI0012F00178|nr:hypothetical protein [Listeria innocua]ECB9830355.1 hypothetical protein [Listeria monocytogenes]MBC1353676.1 hypothetical protein [Listeria innocua]